MARSRKIVTEEERAGTALVRRSAPATDLTYMDLEQEDALQERVAEVSESAGNMPCLAIGHIFGSTIYSFMGGAAVVTAVAGAWPLAAITGVCALASGVLRIGGLIDHEKAMISDINGLKDNFCKASMEAQEQAWRERKRQHLVDAEHKLQSGEELELEELAYLVRCDAQELNPASDILAITVLQARQMLAYTGCEELRLDGRPAVAPASSLSRLGYDLRDKEHRVFLRKTLEHSDPVLPEDADPDWIEPDMAALDAAIEQAQKPLKGGVLKHIFCAAVAPVMTVPDLLTVRKTRETIRSLRSEIDGVVEMPDFTPVPDFVERLTAYEQAEGPLELPAVTGIKAPARRSPAGLPKPLQR